MASPSIICPILSLSTLFTMFECICLFLLKFFKVNTSLNALFTSSKFFASILVVVIAISTNSNPSLFIVK